MPLNPALPAILTLAANLRELSARSGLRRPFTLAESIVVALVAAGFSYRLAAAMYGSHVATVATHVRVAADKVLDGPPQPDLEMLSPKLRVFAWARREIIAMQKHAGGPMTV